MVGYWVIIMKTIFISCFHGYISRNILSTDAFATLAARTDLRIVLFVLDYKASYFRERFGGPSVHVEGIAFPPPSRNSAVALLIKRLAKYGLDSASVRIERRIKRAVEHKYVYAALMGAAAWALQRIPLLSRWLRMLLREIDYRLAVRNRFRPFFDRYRPDLVFATDVLNERDVELMHNARYFGVPVAGMARSWDNLTLHGLLRALPGRLLVTAPRVADIAARAHDVPKSAIRVAGVAHYDRYARGPRISREDFLRSLGLDPDRRTVLFAPISDYYLRNNDVDPHTLQLLLARREQLIVRFSPSLAVAALEGWQAPEHVAVDRPGVRFADADQEIRPEDDERLLHELMYSDVLVAGPSTIALDAAYLDRPVVLVGFHPTARTYLEGIRRRYDYDHFRAAIDLGAFRIAHSPQGLAELLDAYLNDPERDRSARRRLCEIYAGPSDGRSGLRIAQALLDALGLPLSSPR